MKWRLLFIVLMLVAYHSNILSQQQKTVTANEKKEKNLANVAILNFTNKTGSEAYNWLHGSLGNAVYESMQETFLFNRTGSSAVDEIIKNRFKPDREPNSADIAFLAEKSNSDIVVFGEFDLDKGKNVIKIKTKIFHATRGAITAIMMIESKTDSSLFGVVDNVSARIVNHIAVIAKEDIERAESFSKKKKPDSGKTVNIESPEKDKVPDKIDIGKKDDKKADRKEKITLQKAGDLKAFTAFYIDIALVYYSPSLVAAKMESSYKYNENAQNIVSGAGLRFSITNSYRSFFLFGACFNATYVFFPNAVNGYRNINISGNLQPIIGLNWNIKNKVFIQPYVQAGIQLEFLEVTTKDGSLSRLNAGGAVIAAGIRVPVRIGRDSFLTPFVEVMGYLSSQEKSNSRLQMLAGIGISF